ncbi:MAG: DUF1549 and DUF1553 domain-containing protein [Acidobacteriota bacterium]
MKHGSMYGKKMTRFWARVPVAAVFFVPLLLGAASLGKAADDERFTRFQRQHWAFQEIKRSEIPAVGDSQWARNPIDAFVLARLEAEGIEPSPRADKITLIRRAYLDVIGLPPTLEEVEAFVNDESPDAFEEVIDRLLDSPHYGERWARHWLDLARYAESEGFNRDQTRPNAWRYREYVIDSFNQDKPYDRFVREQIAGDELWPDDPDARVATAFNRNYRDEYNAADLRQRRQEILHDITSTVGAVFMGLTYQCATCHDHKFDPILQADYYRLQAFFSNVIPNDDIIALSAPDVLQRHRQQMAEWEEKTAHIREPMAALEKAGRAERQLYWIGRYSPEVQKVLFTSPAKRTPYERTLYEQAKIYMNPEHYLYQVSMQEVVSRMEEEDEKRWEQLNAELEEYAHLHPGELPLGMGIKDAGREAPPTYILSGGSYQAPLEEVQPGFLTLLDPDPAQVIPPPGLESSGRRSALVNWLVDPKNPLTSRVMVNRLWHYHFGRGIVDTPSNFGLAGGQPSHPELLDWLATEFLRAGWSMKSIHRLILTSNVYQQSSLHREEPAKIDPENRLLWRFSRQRLQGEILRDAALAVSGLLNPQMGGPSVFPPLPAGLTVREWETSEDPRERNRRSIYTFIRRNVRYPFYATFDMPDTNDTCARRETTTTPLQALMMMNSEVVLEWAEAFAGRILLTAGSNPEKLVDTAYRLAYYRPPAPEELTTALNFLERQRELIVPRAAAGEDLAQPPQRPYNVDSVDVAALVDLCHMILNSNEFVYLN